MHILYHHRTQATDAQRVHILEIVHALRELDHTVEICALVDTETPRPYQDSDAPPSRLAKLKDVPYLSEFAQLAYNLYAIPKILWHARRLKPTMIYERYALFNCAGVVAARMLRIPIILEVNSPLALEENRESGMKMLALASWMEKQVCNASTKTIVVTGALKKIMISFGVQPDKLVVVSNGVNPDSFTVGVADPALVQKFSLAGRVVIGFVGWFRPWHGLDLLIEAFAKAGLHSKNTVMLLIGDGPARADLERLVSKLDLAQHILFTGALSHDAVPAHLNLLDIAVQPAANEYCCPMKILEYFGLGKPVIAPRQENIEELVRDGEDALLFTPGDVASLADALMRLTQDAPLRTRMSANAAAAIETRGYLWANNAQRIVDMAAAGIKI